MRNSEAFVIAEVLELPVGIRGRAERNAHQLYFDLHDAAAMLGTTQPALKKYLARHQRRDGRDTVCALGDGVRAVKVRGAWRVRFGKPITK